MTKNFILKELCRYPSGTFAETIYRKALFHPDDEAFAIGSKRVTFSQFNRRVNSLVHALMAAGCVKGDVIGILSWNCLEYVEVYGAAMKGGFILAHLNPRLSVKELLGILEHTGIKVLFCAPEFAGMAVEFQQRAGGVERWVGFDPDASANSYQVFLEGHSGEEIDVDLTVDDPVTIIFTSGTTGTPKGAVYSHRQKMDNTACRALELGTQFGDRNLVALPMFHIAGDSHMWPFFLMGGCNVIMKETAFNPAAMLKAIQDEKITDIIIVPTLLIALLNTPDIDRYDLRSLKRIWYAASPMPTEVLKRGLQLFGPVFMQGYGMTESGPDATMLPREAHHLAETRSGTHDILTSCGRPSAGAHIRIVDEEGLDLPAGEIGEIIVRSGHLMTGYWRQPEETAKAIKDGWLYTGDMGFYDENAYIYIADRKKDMIITGGENVYSKEVEEVLYQHPAVYEAAVVGVSDPYWVERVHAVIVLNDSFQVTAEEIIRFCRDRMTHYKAPKSVEFVTTLPKSPQGKVLKRELRKLNLKG